MKLAGSRLVNVALAVVALGSAAVVLATSQKPGTTELLERQKNLIGTWNDDDVRSVTFRGPKASFRLERSGNAAAAHTAQGDFELLAPEREPADAAAVDRLLSGLGLATFVRKLEGDDRHALGFDAPEVTLEIDAGARKLSLALGKAAPAPEGAAYVALAGGPGVPLSVVPKDVALLFRMTPDDFRPRALVEIGQRETKELSLERPGDTLRLVRSGSGFRIDGRERANRALLEPVFGALARLDARRFLPLAEAEKARGGAPSLVVRVTPTEAQARPSVVELGGVCPGFPGEVLAITRSPRVRAGCVEGALVTALGLERATLSDREPFQARSDEVETLRIERGGKRLVLTRRGSAFLLREPSEAAVELEAGNQRLDAVLHAPAEFVANADLEKLGLKTPAGRVVVTRIAEDDKAVEETLELGRVEADGTLHARRADDGAVLTLGRDAARAFAVDTTLLRSLKVVDFSLSSLAELELSTPERQLLKRAPNGFELEVPRGFQHDGSLATDAVLALGSLTALRFVADANDGSFGLEKPTLTASARYDADGGARSIRLVVGRSTPGGFFARLDGDPSVFVVERAAAERLGTLLVDRSAFMADPKTLARVTVTRGGVTRTLERSHDELVPTAGSGLDAAVGARLIEALGALRPEAAVHTGPARPDEGFASPQLEVRYEPVAGSGKARSFRVGASASAGGVLGESGFRASHYGRADGVDATFILEDSQLKPLFDLF